MLIQLLDRMIRICNRIDYCLSEKEFSKQCVLKMKDKVGSLSYIMQGLVNTVEKSNQYLCDSDDMISDIITDFMHYLANSESALFCLRNYIKNIYDKREKYHIGDKVDYRCGIIDLSSLFRQILRVYQDINNVVGVEITPLYKIKRAQEITKKLDIILHNFADYVSTVEQAIPQTKKEIQFFLKTVDKFLAKIQRHAMYQDRFTRFMIGRYNLYTDNMLDSSCADC